MVSDCLGSITDLMENYLTQIHFKFPKCYLFLDKAPQHYKSQKVRHYFEKHKDVLIPVWLPRIHGIRRMLEYSPPFLDTVSSINYQRARA
jgi:hypothetical protein